MRAGDSIRKNLHFWHWYPRLLCEDLTENQLHWQPEGHPNHIVFATWHAYRSEDEIVHGMLARQPSVFAREGWAKRLPVAEPGDPPFGTGLGREQIAAIRLPLDELLAYAEAVGASMQAFADSLTDEQAAEMVPMPFFTPVYPTLDSMSKEEALTFFCVGHTAEHLGEVQYIKGLLGLTGAPL
ncbi:MAG: DinB family protein [Chloroflexota bacterium]